MNGGLELAWIAGTYAVARLDAAAEVPAIGAARFLSVTRTVDELSIVCAQDDAPASARVEGPYALLRVVGTLAHDLTGILVRLLVPLGDARVPIFALSTFDTDYLLVPAGDRARAEAALVAAGHRFVGPEARE